MGVKVFNNLTEADAGPGARTSVSQLPLFPHDEPAAPAPRLRNRNPEDRGCNPIDRDPLGRTYLRRLKAQGVAPAGYNAYRYQLGAILRIAERLRGEAVTLAETFRDQHLLGQTLTYDLAPVRGHRISKWTLAQRRSAARSFVSLMMPEFSSLLDCDPHVRIDDALQSAAERVGTGFRLTGGQPRRRGGEVPTSDEVRAVIKAASRVPGFRGIRNEAFLLILASTGTHVNALRNLDGCDCVEMPSGRLRFYVHDKGKLEPRELELSFELSEALRSYIGSYNWRAAGRRWRARIQIGKPGPIWRNSSRGCWSYDSARKMFHDACNAAGVAPFTPHALRRAFATDVTSMLPRHVVALAGGWQGLERMDDHYIRPHQREIWRKLNGNVGTNPDVAANEWLLDAPAVII
jgi:integrase